MSEAKKRRRFAALCFGALAASAFFCATAFAVDGGRALLIGVNRYEQASGLTNLRYCVADAEALRARLLKNGFEKENVVCLSDAAGDERNLPTLNAARRELDALRRSSGTVAIVYLGGHGASFNGESRFALRDARRGDLIGTTLAVDEVVEALAEAEFERKFIFIDACRNALARGTAPFAKNEDVGEFAKNFTPRQGVRALLSCSLGEVSIEDSAFQHGVFTKFLLDGLLGRADVEENGNRDGKVDFLELFQFTAARTREKTGQTQNPCVRMDGDYSAATVAFVDSGAEIREDDARCELSEVKERRRVASNSLGMEFVQIEPGTFWMGSAETPEELVEAFNSDYDAALSPAMFEDEYPARRVRVAKSFWIGRGEVSIEQFARFVEETGYETDAERDGRGGFGLDARGKPTNSTKFSWREIGVPQCLRTPVVDVSWNDAVAFCRWLSEKEGRTYRLPTEVEWEYVCRAGTGTRYWFGDDPEELAIWENVADESARRRFPEWKSCVKSDDGFAFAAPIDAATANPWEVFGMCGNVCEWCADVDPNDPRKRIVRGGSWFNWANTARASNRSSATPSNRHFSVGFRVVLDGSDAPSGAATF